MSRILNCGLSSAAGPFPVGTSPSVWALPDNGPQPRPVYNVRPLAEPGRMQVIFEDCVENGGVTITVNLSGYVEQAQHGSIPPAGGQNEGPAFLMVRGGVNPFDVPVEVLRAFRGNFCGLPFALPSFPGRPTIPYGQLFTPGWPCYYELDHDLGDRILTSYAAMGLTHFPLNAWGGSTQTVYRNYYPPWDDTRISTYTQKIWDAGLYPLHCVFPDDRPIVNPALDPGLVRLAFWWEDSTPITAPWQGHGNKFWVVSQAYPHALVYWHNPPGQDAPYVDPALWGGNDDGLNGRVWSYMINQSGVQGLLFQGEAWENPANSVANLQDFVDRLVHGKNGWPIAVGGVNDFEETARYTFGLGGSYAHAKELTHTIWNSIGSQLEGFGNGD